MPQMLLPSLCPLNNFIKTAALSLTLTPLALTEKNKAKRTEQDSTEGNVVANCVPLIPAYPT